jgi:hypothetical protein
MPLFGRGGFLGSTITTTVAGVLAQMRGVHSGRGRIAARDRDADMGILGQAVGAHGIEDGARHGFAAEK